MVYEQLKAKTLPLIEAYHDDLLKHDKQMIADNPGVPFLHWTGKYGTHMVLLHPASVYPRAGTEIPYLFGHAGRDRILDGVYDVALHCSERKNGNTLALHFNGKTIREIPMSQSSEIAWDYTCEIRNVWRAAEPAYA